jgi:hypothetical protein
MDPDVSQAPQRLATLAGQPHALPGPRPKLLLTEGTMLLRRFVVCVSISACLLLTACSEDKPAVGPGDSLGADTGEDIGGLDSGAEDVQAPPDVPEIDVPEDVPTADIAQQPYPPCNKNDECASGFCLPTPDGNKCAPLCSGDAGCNKEYVCQAVSGSGDVIYACVHPAPFKCKPCKTSADCASGANKKKGVCVDLGQGAACLEDCSGDGSCVGDDVTCGKSPASSIGGGLQVCIPSSGQCACPDGGSGACQLKNDFGVCSGSYQCAANLPGACSGTVPAAETCNLVDDDCNGKTDEDVPVKTCAITGVYGTCQGKTLCVGGQELCQGAGASSEVCNGIDDNCSGVTDEGFADADGDKLADCMDEDDDGDGVADGKDVCPLAADPSQTDTDKDGQGDACDADDDNDKVLDGEDNCPLAGNASQTDTDKDALGDACDCDLDGDGLSNLGTDVTAVACPEPATPDNCLLVANADQIDSDIDGLGDACDGDKDGDGVLDGQDDCPLIVNADQADNDKDGLGQPCDPDDDNDGVLDEGDDCPLAANPSQTDSDVDGLGDACDSDLDGDGVANAQDNCPGKANADQMDLNGNKIGDLCEGDWDSDGAKNEVDNCPWIANPDQQDTDKDTTGDACDCDADGDAVANFAPGCPNDVTPDNCALLSNAEQTDLDGDGLGDACDGDLDGDGDLNASDCQPKNKAVSKLASESCNGVDDDCDGQTDEEAASGCKQMYFDEDGDGFGVTLVKCLCAPLGPYAAAQAGDCADKDALVHPSAKELCGNGKDDNCNGSENDVDAGSCAKFYSDGDGDGIGSGAAVCLCTGTSEFSAKSVGDCNDGDPAIAPGLQEKCGDGKDNDCDGATDQENCLGCTVLYLDVDGDGYGLDSQKKCLSKAAEGFTATKAGDCDDSKPAIHPGVAEACNTLDDNCNGVTDEEAAAGCSDLYADTDGDGFGVGSAKCLCAKTGLYTAVQSGDCNDKDAAVTPAATEVCGNGKDDNCNGSENDENAINCLQFFTDIDGDGYGVGAAKCFCSPSGNLTAKQGGDCNDNDTAASPGQVETCLDGKDNNCNAKIDEAGCQGCSEYYKDADQDNYGLNNDKQCLGAAKYPYTAFVGGDCDDTTANVKPGATEVCNAFDDNCDGQIDPVGAGGCTNFYPDADKDSFGASVTPVCYCKATGDWTANKTGDCNDNDAAVNPSKTEACNGADDNCNGQIDEGVVLTFYKDNDGDGFGSVTSQQGCKAPLGYTLTAGDCNDFNKAINPGAAEVCNDIDDDCNSVVDNGIPVADMYADLDGDGFGGKNAKAQKHCLFGGTTPPIGYALSHDDCDDSKSTVYPDAPELCDGILNNCNQAVQDAQCPKKCEGTWPVFLGGSEGYPAIAQLDGDNELEVLTQNEGHLRAFKANGALAWDTAVPISYSYPALADFNNDATVDAVVSGHDGAVHIINGNTGAELAKIPAGTAGYYGAAVLDIDRDGVPDIVPTGGGSYKILLMNANLTLKSLVTLAPLAGEYFSLASPGLFDLAGDGVPEIFLGSGNWTCQGNTQNCKGRVYAFDVSGAYANDPNWTDASKPWFKVAGYPYSYAGEGNWPLYADLDGDGVNEIHHYFTNSGSDLWKKDGTEHPLSGKNGLGTFPVMAPVDAMGKLDTSGKLTSVGGAIADIDSDGDYETIGYGVAVIKQGKIMDGFPLKVSAGRTIVSDINRDGQLDLLFISGSNNSLNCYTLGAGTYADERVLNAGTLNGLGRNHYPTMGYDPFEPNDVRNVPFDPATSKNPLLDSRAFRISALRDAYASGNGWKHKVQAVLGEKGDRDYYVLYGGIAYVTLSPMLRDYDLYLHIFKSDGTFLATWNSVNAGAAADTVMCHSTNGCPAGAGMFIIEVRGKDPAKDFGPWPYWLTTNWAQ